MKSLGKLCGYLFMENWYTTVAMIIINLINYLYRFITYRGLTEYISSLVEIGGDNILRDLIYFFTKLTVLHIIHIVTSYFLNKSVIDRVKTIFVDLVKKMVYYKLEFFRNENRDRFIQLWDYMYSAEELIRNIILDCPKIFIYLLYYTYTIYTFSSNAVLAVLAVNAIVIYTLHPWSLKQYKYQEERMELDMDTKNKYLEMVNNMEHIKLSGKENDESDRILKSYNSYHDNKGRDSIISYSTSIFSEIINDLIMFIIYIIGYSYVLNGSMKPIELLYLAVHTGNFYNQINSLKETYNTYKKVSPKLDIIFDILNYEKSEQAIDCISKPVCSNNKQDTIIEFHDVSFGYDVQKNILQNLSFIIKRDKINVIIGPNGSGKSTIINLVLRLYEQSGDKGSIHFNGVNIKSYSLKQLRKKFAVIYQDPSLFNESLWYNLTYGSTNDNLIFETAYLINFYDYIKNNKSNSIGFMGSNLSGGEKKKVQLINALSKDVDVLVFDEPTNALDVDTTNSLIECIKKMNKTIIIITHDERMVSIADNIVRL